MIAFLTRVASSETSAGQLAKEQLATSYSFVFVFSTLRAHHDEAIAVGNLNITSDWSQKYWFVSAVCKRVHT